MENVSNMHYHPRTPHKHEGLISTLFECARACEQAMFASLVEESDLIMARCFELQRECSEICFLGGKLLIRESSISHKFLSICEEMCSLCAQECSKHDHLYCKECADACRKCESACHEHYGKEG